jgi:enoyl-CoA hydratase/carnithine racemase
VTTLARRAWRGDTLREMRTTAGHPSSNGHGSAAWSESWRHLSVDRRSPAYCRITFHNPPVNAITATTLLELAEVIDLIEQDPDLNVVVFDSANPAFFLSHHPGGPTGLDGWLDLLARLSRAPTVSIASIRGRARGAGTEFVLACDMRFASRENTLLGPFDTQAHGTSMAGLSRLAGRGRALEVLLASGDCDGPRAERYGLVNRAIADDDLDREVDAIAARLARFDHDIVARTKAYAG